jgi:GNAT superfamily N-acetyltransferase
MNIDRFTITTEPTEEEMKVFQDGLEEYNMSQTAREFNSPQPWLSLVLKDHEGTIVGGILTSTLYWTQYLEVLWVDKKYRGLGYGRDLINEAHRLAKKQGCVSSHTYTFSWQAPDFYQAVGYKLIATYDGYVGGIKEYILMKKFDKHNNVEPKAIDSTRFIIVEDSTPDSQAVVRRGLGSNFDDHVNEVQKEYPHLGFKFILKNKEGKVIGGIDGYTTLGTMYTDGLWVDEDYRGQGYGKILLQQAENLAKERRCVANQSACFSFQNLEIFKKQGYEFYGHTDAYPNKVIEYFLIKRL